MSNNILLVYLPIFIVLILACYKFYKNGLTFSFKRPVFDDNTTLDDKLKKIRQWKIMSAIKVLYILAVLVTIITLILFAKNHRKQIDITTHREINIMIVPNNLPLEEKEQLVFESLISAGYSVAGACGIMGNIAVESPDFDPALYGSGNDPYGLFQWTSTGDRKNRLRNWCSNHKLNSDSIEGQLAFAIYELSGGDSIAARLDDFLKNTDDAYAACVEFAAGFERCIADDNSNGKNDTVYKGSLYPEFYNKKYQGLKLRINKSLNYYERFKTYPAQIEVYNTEDLSDDIDNKVKIINISL